MATPVLAVILWIVLTGCIVLLTKNYVIKWSGVSTRSFWRNSLRVYISFCTMGSATIVLAIYVLIKGIA